MYPELHKIFVLITMNVSRKATLNVYDKVTLRAINKMAAKANIKVVIKVNGENCSKCKTQT